MNPRAVILSDLHLGRPHGSALSAEALRPLWLDARHLIINGDAAEVHHPRHWSTAARQTLHLFDLCEADGVDLTLLSGNHDPFISDLRHLHLAGGQVFITHGDVLHPAVAPWSPAAARMRTAHDAAMAALGAQGRDDLQSRLSASQHAAYAQWQNLTQLKREASRSSLLGMMMRPWSLLKVINYWRIAPKLAATFACEHAPEARFVVLGHTHHPGQWQLDGRVVINTGSFGFPGSPRGVVIEDAQLLVYRVRYRRGGYRFDDEPLARYPLDSGDSSSDESAPGGCQSQRPVCVRSG